MAITEPEEGKQVHKALFEALQDVLLPAHGIPVPSKDATPFWNDLVDRLVLKLAGTVVLVHKKRYDELLIKLSTIITQRDILQLQVEIAPKLGGNGP